MKKCTSIQLAKALSILASIHPFQSNEQITAIQFEDGSGNKFNYQVNGGEWKFIDLSPFL